MSKRRRGRMDARAIVVGALGAFIALEALLSIALWFSPLLRDPDYGNRLARLESLRGEHPDRSLLLLLGSSRTALGVRPDVVMQTWSESGEPPLVFNFSRIGNGPLFELLYLHRVLARGIRPDWVLLELWPIFLDDRSLDGREDERMDVHWLEHADFDVLARHSTLHDDVVRQWWWDRLVPWYSQRSILMSYFAPHWRKLDPFGTHLAAGLDRWGWLDAAAMNRQRYTRESPKMVARYGRTLRDFRPSERADGELREILDVCRARNVPVTLLFMPESRDLRSTYGDTAKQRLVEYVQSLSAEYGTPTIDASDWAPDEDFGDAGHLTAAGSLVFSRRLAERTSIPTKGRPLALRTDAERREGVRLADVQPRG